MSDGGERGGETRSTIARPRLEEPELPATGYLVVVVQGPDRGLRLSLDGARSSHALIGKSSVCQLRLTDPLVSRRHASVDVTHKGLRLVDLDSSNGTTVAGLRIGEVHLRGGEVVRMGDTTLHVERSAAATADALGPERRFGRVIGVSPEMRRLYPLCRQLASGDAPIVIEGETGTGKELMAEALHDASPRARGPFVVFDCTAVRPNQIEAVLFGRADGEGGLEKGLFEEASGGTLLIDEIGDLDLAMQPKLLRAIANSEIQPVGTPRRIHVDTRIIAATQRDLDREVHAGRFRDDLFFRLGPGLVRLPPLRDRTGDVAALARHFWRAYGDQERPMPSGLLERLCDHRWPGNVRELQNAVARVAALGEVDLDEPTADGRTVSAGEPVVASPAADFIAETIARGLPLTRARDHVIAEFERRYVLHVLDRYDGSVSRAAAASGIARRYFQLLKARHAKP